MYSILAVLLYSVIITEASTSVQGYFDFTKDGNRFKNLFQEAIASKDLASIYYSVQGLQYLKEKVNNPSDICKDLAVLTKGSPKIEQSFYAANTYKTLQCKEQLNPEILKSAKKVIGDTAQTDFSHTLTDLAHAINIFKILNEKITTKESVIKILQEFLKKDDSITNLGLVFHICSEITCGSWATERIEDAIIQADEIDGKLLNWEGGLPITSLVLTGIIKLLQSVKKAPLITPDQSVKFGNYLLSRKSVQTAKGACVLLEVITDLANDGSSPMCITLKGSSQIQADSEPITVIISDLLGRRHPLNTPDTVQAESVTRLQDDVVILSKQKLTSNAKEPTLYSLDLMKVKPNRGLYKLTLSASSKIASLPIRVLGTIDIHDIEVGVGDVDGASNPRLTSVTYPNKLNQPFEVDSLQKIIVKFSLKEKGQNQIAKVHQAFVRIFSKTSNVEVILVAEMETAKIYKMDADIGSIDDRFNHESGLYSIELIIGDASISNPIRWILADVTLKFTASQKEIKVPKVIREVKPEIKHMFREPEPRPSKVVSDVYTGLCIAPMLLLFILWFKIGINVKNFPFSLSSIGFHLGFGGILGLFTVFWLKLTMFETIRYLLAIGLITFICGHRLLRNIAAKRKQA